MAATNAVEKITIQGDAIGFDEATAKVHKLGAAHEQLGKQMGQAADTAETTTRRRLSTEKALEAVQRRLDVEYRQMQNIARDQAVLTQSYHAGSLELGRYNDLMAQVPVHYGRMASGAKVANDNVRLTTNQMQGLGYQINDMGTMLAMGASPFQIMASQAGQVVQVLGDGPQGIKGSLAAIGSAIAGFARAIPGPVYAVAGLTAGVAALWAMMRGPEARTAEQSLATFDEAIKRLEGSWKGAADAARAHNEEAKRSGDSAAAALLDVGGNIRDLQADLRNTIRELNTSDELSGTIIRPFSGAVSDARQEIISLYADLRGGRRTIAEVAEELLRIRLDPQNEGHARAFADEIRRALEPAAELERRIQALNLAAARLAAPKGTMGRHDLPAEVSDGMFGAPGSDNRFGPGDGMDRIREGLQAQREEAERSTRTIGDYTKSVADMRAGLASSVAGLQLQVDTFGQSEGAIAAARFEMDAMADATRAATEAGKSSVDPALVGFIKEQAAQYGALTDQVSANTKAEQERQRVIQEAESQRKRISDFEADLAFERSIIGLPEAEQDVRATLQRLGVDFNSFEGQRLAAGLRQNDQLREMQEEMLRTGEISEDVFGTLIDALTSGGSLVDNLIEAFGGLGKQFAALGAKKLFKGLFGDGSTDVATGLGQVAGSLAKSTGGSAGFGNFATVTPTSRPAYTPQDVAAVSGSVLTYASRFNGAIDKRLTRILETAATNFPYKVEAVSGLRPGDPRFHGKGLAADVQIYGSNGRALGNYQNAADFRVYEKFAQEAKRAQDQLFPELGKLFRWGGYFSGGKGKYGALDSMHFDLGGAGMGGGSFGAGLTAAQRKLWPGVESVGMGSPNSTARVMRQAVSDGSIDAARRMASGAVPNTGGFSTPKMDPSYDTRGASSGGFFGARGQAGMSLIGAGAGAFFNGMQSGPVGGALGGALSGYGAAGSIATAFPALAGVAGPVGMAAGAALGLLGSPQGGGKRRAADHFQKAKDFGA